VIGEVVGALHDDSLLRARYVYLLVLQDLLRLVAGHVQQRPDRRDQVRAVAVLARGNP